MANTFPNPDQFWKKGIAPNPKGRPKGAKTLKTRLNELMKLNINYTDLEGKPCNMLVEDALGLALMAKALTTGDIKAIEMIKNELEGDQIKDVDLSERQREIVQRAMQRALPDFHKIKEVHED